MKILLTGGTGFIGSYIAVELAGHRHQVTILARNRNKVPALAQIGNIEICEGDITDRGLLDRLVVGQDACIHVALNYTKKTGWEVLSDDTLPTVYLAEAAARAQVKQLIYTSSTSVDDCLYTHADLGDGVPVKKVTCATQQRPATFYGATKAASENFLIALAYSSALRVNIVRPGYTFGNPVVAGANTQADKRFHDIVHSVKHGQPLGLVKNDGTQFIWAGDLAKLYAAILQSDVNRKTYFGLGSRFISWSAIAEEAAKQCHVPNPVVLEDKGWSDTPLHWDVADMQRDFGLEFDAWERIREHVAYWIGQE